ncbi:DevR family CRISPR-associated autoregulator [Flexithrix dorotheae]|uniref:DevR family CRISPR-associated autoregulator n=1 Tax=Flexithrix dorotheae TaxID=70993 RepID=UPI000377E19D|nr:DevR family CRISPR-associated autoregulator [Flexithrix dorotheae]
MSTNNNVIASLSISGEITLNLHSLNNEGGEGNQVITRQVTIVDENGETHTVNAISGDMFKHIHVGHLINLAKEKELPLCSNCKVFNPNRLSSGEDLGTYFQDNENYTDSQVVGALIELCVVDDTHGVLVTKIGGKNKNVPRKSVVEFGWTVGIPNKNNTESYVHTKLVADSTGVRGEGSNEGQNIFHRPANYGIYAFVCNVDIYRIGFNDISRKYNLSEIERENRYKALVQSLLNAFVNPQGAMTSTQKPHITNFNGVVAVSSRATPAPTISALNKNFAEEIKKITENINKIENGAISLKPFNGLGELSGVLAELIQYTPYEIPTSET